MGKVSSLLGMAADEASAARKAQAEFRGQMFEGISDVGGAIMSMDGVKGGVDGGGTEGGVGSDIEKLLGDLSEEELQELIRKTGGDASGGGTGLQLPGGGGYV